MTLLRQRMIADLQRRGLAERTQDADIRAVRQLAAHSHTSPARITEEELRHSCLSLKNVKPYSRRASPIALCGITCFSEPTLKRPWSTRTCVRAPREKTLPVVRSVAAGRTLLAHLKLLRSRTCLRPMDAGGLRLPEGTHLQVPAIESARRLVHVHPGKGATDREGPLPQRPLELLRPSGKTPRHPPWLLPAPGRGGIGMATASEPMPRSSVQEACRAALKQRGINQHASVHTLRHSSATPLLAAGVHLRLLQASWGHHSPTTTALSPQLTVKADAMARAALTDRRADR